MKAQIAIILALILTGCVNEDPAPANLIGRWFGYLDSTTSCNTPANNGENLCGTHCNYYVFTESTFTFSGSSWEISGTYTVKGDSIFMPELAYLSLDKRSFKLEENTLTLSYQGLHGCISNNLYERK